jgi:tripeptide aminopeptidase
VNTTGSRAVAAAHPLAGRVLERTRAIAAIPGPPRDEAERAACVRSWWEADGIARVHEDGAGNVWGCVRAGHAADPSAGAVVIAAHLDTVFPRTMDLTATVVGDRLCGPGVGDDGIALAALSTLDGLLGETERAVWILATVGEEGAGDLYGARAAMQASPVAIDAFIALEGNYLGRICAIGVGSHRERVTVSGPGGHSWEAAAAANAIHAAAAAIQGAGALAAPFAEPRQTVNVGLIEGGEAINARARNCSFEIDLRADDASALEMLIAGFDGVLHDVASTYKVEVARTITGQRPAGRIAADHALVVAAVEALAAIDRVPRFVAASTDANAAHAAGVPAIAIGITEGAGEHTAAEWIAIPPIGDGLHALADTVSRMAS